MWSKDKIVDILNNSGVLKIAGLSTFVAADCIYMNYSDMHHKSVVYPCRVIEFADKFALNSFAGKERLSYEFFKNETTTIERLSLENYNSELEILMTKDEENKEKLSLVITDEFRKNTYLLSISSQGFSLSMDYVDKMIRLDYSKGKDNIIKYEENNGKDSLNFEINRGEMKSIIATFNGENIFLNSTVLSDLFTDFTLDYYINLFFNTKYIQEVISHILNKMDHKAINLYDGLKQFAVYKDLSEDKSTLKSEVIRKLLGLNIDLNDLLEKSKVVNIEEEHQKRLRPKI